MKPLLILLIMFCQIDTAVANDSVRLKLIQDQLERLAGVRKVPMPTPPLRLQEPAEQPTVLSCDITLQPQRQDLNVDYSCDAIKTLKTETLAIAAN